MTSKYKFTAFLILFAALLLVVSIVSACSNSNNNQETATPEATTPANTATPSTPASSADTGGSEDLAFKPYDEPIEISTTNRVRSDFPHAPGTSATDNSWTRLVKEKLNVDLTYKYIATTLEESTTKGNLMLASGDFPDYFAGSLATLEQLYAVGKLTDMTEIFDKYASPLLKEYFNTESGQKALRTATKDGKLLGLPRFRDNKEESNVLWVRKDWLDKLGLPEPKTLQDVITIAKAFVTQDPDGNGLNDTIGLPGSKDVSDYCCAYFSFDSIFAAYQGFPRSWVEAADGTLVYGGIQPEIKEALKTIQQMYKDGLIDQEFATKEIDPAAESIINNSAGIFYGGFGNPNFSILGSKRNDPTADWATYPIPSSNDKPAKIYTSPTNLTGIYFAPVTSKHPEVVILLANLYVETVFGPNSTQENWDTYYLDPETSAEYWSLAPLYIDPADKGWNTHMAILDVLAGKKKKEDVPSYSRVPMAAVDDYLKTGNVDNYGMHMLFGEKGGWSIGEYYRANDLFMPDAYVGPVTQTMQDKRETLKTLQVTAYTKIAMGEPIELFDKYVQDWKNLGGDQITKEVNEYYSQNK